MKPDEVTKYKAIKQELEELKADLMYTNRAMANPRLDYMTRREYQTDIIHDNRRIAELNEQLNRLFDFIYQNNMQDAIDEINRLKELEQQKVKKQINVINS